MLSKTCSNEAYYYINKDAEDPEVDLFVPVLLRKTAVAWNISYVIETCVDANFIRDKCTRDNRVRSRRSMSAKGPSNERAYFMYDFPASHSRQIGVVSKWNGPSSLDDKDDSFVVFKLRVEYTSIEGDRYWQEQLVTKHDVIVALNQGENEETMTVTCKHELQMISGDILRSAAEHVKCGDKSKSKDVMLNGKRSLEELMNEYGVKAQTVTSTENTAVFKQYAKSVVDNIGALIDTIEQSAEGETWNKMKAVSTAIVRETPNVGETVLGGDVLCPIPEVEYMGRSEMKDSVKRLIEKNKRSSGGSPVLNEDLYLYR